MAMLVYIYDLCIANCSYMVSIVVEGPLNACAIEPQLLSGQMGCVVALVGKNASLVHSPV